MRRLASLLLLALLPACGGRNHPGEVQGPNKLSEIAVVVENQHTGTISLYLESNGRSVRIGEVHFSETRSFVMPWRSLSENRAKAVADFLVSQGIAAGNVTSQGFGSANPVASNDTPEGKAQNRRVEIAVS
mgnify:CR=1 FL=1